MTRSAFTPVMQHQIPSHVCKKKGGGGRKTWRKSHFRCPVEKGVGWGENTHDSIIANPRAYSVYFLAAGREIIHVKFIWANTLNHSWRRRTSLKPWNDGRQSWKDWRRCNGKRKMENSCSVQCSFIAHLPPGWFCFIIGGAGFKREGERRG